MPKVEIKHWDDSKKKTTPIVFLGQPGKTIIRYIQFLDAQDTKRIMEKISNWKIK